MIFKIYNLFKSKFVTVVEKYRSWSLYNSVRILVASDYQLVTLQTAKCAAKSVS